MIWSNVLEYCGLQQFEKLIHRQVGATNQRAQYSDGKFLVLGDGEVGPDTVLAQHQMTADLPDLVPPRLLERLDRILAGDVAEFPHDQTATMTGVSAA